MGNSGFGPFVCMSTGGDTGHKKPDPVQKSVTYVTK